MIAPDSERPADRHTQIVLMNKLCAAFTDRVALSSIRFASAENGKHVGSGCLLCVDGRLFALTASHVVMLLLQEMQAAKRVIIGWGARDVRGGAAIRLPFKKRIPRKAKKRLKKIPGRLRRDAQGFRIDQNLELGIPVVRILALGHERPISEEDAALVELSPEALEKIPSACVLTLDDLYPLSEETPLAPGELVGVVGTPIAFCAPTSPQRSNQPSLVLAYVNLVDGVDHDMGDRLLVRLSSGFTAGGVEAIPPSPDGMSGGAVWWIPAGSPSVKQTIDRARVVGIQLAVNESQSLVEMAEPPNPPQRTLMIGPIRHWLNILMRIDEQLVSSVTRWLANLTTSGNP
jgi:hypothetical protein